MMSYRVNEKVFEYNYSNGSISLLNKEREPPHTILWNCMRTNFEEFQWNFQHICLRVEDIFFLNGGTYKVWLVVQWDLLGFSWDLLEVST